MKVFRLFFCMLICGAVVGVVEGGREESPVVFPETGCLPAMYPPDEAAKDQREPEKDYVIFSTPERSLDQIAKIREAMPKGTFTPPPNDWKGLPRTRKVLREGGALHILALGDSIVNDAMRSGWVANLRAAHPKADIRATVYVRGGGGCQHFCEEDRIRRHVLPLKPDVIIIGGISQGSLNSIREVIRQVRRAAPEMEFVLATGAFGTVDARDVDRLARAPHSGTGPYGAGLRRLAEEERCAYVDFTKPWSEYIRSTEQHPHRFYRDPVHANEFGEQILGKIFMAFWQPAGG